DESHEGIAREGARAGWARAGGKPRGIAPPTHNLPVYSIEIAHVKRGPPLSGDRSFVMRILLLADVHANWPALRSINEPHDVCLCLGDLVDYGLDPAPCVDWARQQATITIRGNHDHGVAQNV